MSVLETHLYQCTSWHCCERLHLTSVNFFWSLFEHICPFRDGRSISTSAHTVLSVQKFLTKNGMTPVPTLLIHPILTQEMFFVCFPGWKKYSKGNILLMWKSWKKMAKALKVIKIDEFKNCFEQWEKYLDRCTASNGDYFEGDRILNFKNTQFFNK